MIGFKARRAALSIASSAAVLLLLAFPTGASAFAPAVLTATNFNATEGTALTNQLVANYTGACSPLACTATIDWGDGTSAGQPAAVGGSVGAWTVTASHTYQEDGRTTVPAGKWTTTVTLLDNGATLTSSGAASVAESAIVLTPAVVAGGNEPFTPGLLATFTDVGSPDPASAYSAGISWGDGTTNTSSANITKTGPGAYSISGGHTYVDEGTYSISIFVSELSSGGGQSTSTSVTVSEGDVLTAGAPMTVQATESNTPSTLTVATFTDTYSGQVASDMYINVTWSDTNSSGGSVIGSAGSYSVTVNRNFSDEGTYTAVITVNDDGTGAVLLTLNATVVVAEGDALAGQGTNFSVLEQVGSYGGPVATFTGLWPGQTAGDFTATVDWGDGTTTPSGSIVQSGTTLTVNGGHTYADEGTYSTTVTLQDDGSGSAFTAGGTATITEADNGINSSSAGPLTGVEGTAFSGQVGFFTIDCVTRPLASDFIATIDWGDGTTGNGTITVGSAGTACEGGPSPQLIVSGTHTYDEGSFTYKVTITDDGTGTFTSMVQSTAVFTAATITAGTVPNFTATAGVAFANKPVATFTDNGGKEVLTDYSVKIAWGDGTTTICCVVDPPGTINVFGAHTYANAGTFSVTTTLTDVDGTVVTSAATLVTVAAATPPTAAPAKPLPLLPIALLILGVGLVAATLARRRRSSPAMTTLEEIAS